MKKISVMVIQLGARHHYAIPNFLYKSEILHSFITDGYATKLIRFLLPKRFRKMNQRVSALRIKPVYALNIIGLCSYIPRVYGPKSVQFQNSIFIFNMFFLNLFAILINFFKKSPSHIYSFNGASKLAFKYYRNSIKVLDQAMGPRLFMSEEIIIDEISKKFLTNEKLSYNRLGLRGKLEIKEWELSEKILCPSKFVYDLVIKAKVPKNKCYILNYGVNIKNYATCRLKYRELNKRFKILFVGEVGIRKGVPYLLEYLKSTTVNFECIFAGNITINNLPQSNHIKFLGRVDRKKMLSLYEWADCLIIPSLWEGSATVIYEATASGLPVIASYNSGAPNISNLIEIQVRSVSAIENAIMELLANYKNYLPKDDDIYHVSTERYYRELNTIFCE